MTQKQSKPAMDLVSANCIYFCNVAFSLLSPLGTDLTGRMTCSPHQNCLSSALHFPSKVSVWSGFYTGVFKGRGHKGSFRKDGGEKNHTSMWTAAQAGAKTETVRPFSHWWWWLALQKVGVTELYTNHRLLGDQQQLPGPCQCGCLDPAPQRYHLRVGSLSHNGCILHQQSQKWDHHITDLETAAVKARMTARKTSTLHFPGNHRTKPKDFSQVGTREFRSKITSYC